MPRRTSSITAERTTCSATCRTKLEEGVAVVGSSNLTLSGISHNTELNVVVHGNANHDELVRLV